MHEEIYALALVFAGQEADAGLSACCVAAEAALGARLKQGVTAESCREAMIPAAAWLALSYQAAVRAADGLQSFSVADLSMSKGSLRPDKALRTQAEALMAPYLEDGFSFRGVRS